MSAIPAALKQQFLRVDKRYSINPIEEPFFDMAPSLNLERIEYTPPTAKEIEAEATAEATVAYDKQKNNAEENYLKALDRIAIKKQKALSDYEAKLRKIDVEAKQSASDMHFDLLKRGLALSSVAEQTEVAALTNTDDDKKEALVQYQAALAQYAAEEKNAEKAKNTLLADLKEELDREIKQLVAEKTQKAADKKESAIKYNNTQDEREANYKRSWTSAYLQAQQAHAEQAMKLQNVAVNEGYSVILEYINQDKVTFAKDFYLDYPSARQAYDDFVSTKTEFVQETSTECYDQVERFLKNRL